ncbi:M23 family metallopeptidase [Nocardia pseudovaccinii]|uniref:M23 family metallopeptidase n=1 Tax=Nocardia pseudovaccinii TaxID=189540 RepID=UPI0007A3E0E1|nr:M23 family metallopeptidase [Nocardia pseudovaccinii]
MRSAAQLFGDFSWPIVLVGVVSRSWLADTGGQWLAGVLTVIAMLVLTHEFLAPSLRTAPFPALHLELLALAVSVVAVVRVPRVTGGFLEPGPWIAAALVVAVVSAKFVSLGRAINEPVDQELVFPLGPGRWLIVEGDGRLWNHHWIVRSERAALDIVGLSTWRQTRKRLSARRIEDYLAFGADVYAPCSGWVREAADDTPDDDRDFRRAGGNEVVIDNGKELIVIAHLQRGSVAVEAGQHVEVGQRIGAVGSSGNSTEPHLHIHAECAGEPRRLVFRGFRRRFPRGAVVTVRTGPANQPI